MTDGPDDPAPQDDLPDDPAEHDELAALRATVARLERRLERERTARHEAEQIAETHTRRLFAANAELDARVVARTRELGEAHLAAQEANRAKTRLLGAISHEVFTPVHQARGSIELATMAVEDRWVRDQLARAGDALTAIERLFRNLLVVAEADTRGLQVAMADTALAAVVDATVGHWRPRATVQSSLLVSDVVLPPGYTVLTDDLRLRHALDELLHNAVRFTRGGVVRVGAHRCGDEVAITVADEGPGLPDAMLSHLFEPFSGDQAASGGGLGLGLAAAARIAASLGGRLVRDEQPVGERFSLYLPA